MCACVAVWIGVSCVLARAGAGEALPHWGAEDARVRGRGQARMASCCEVTGTVKRAGTDSNLPLGGWSGCVLVWS